MSLVENFIVCANNILWSYVLIGLLVGLGLWFSLRTKFVQIRMLGEMLSLVKEGIGVEHGN